MNTSLKELIILIFRRTYIQIFNQHKHASSYTNNPMEYNETKTYHNTGMVVKSNLIENSWLSEYRYFNKSGGAKLLAWPQTLD